MNKVEFVDILDNPDLVSEGSLAAMKEILDEFPFFQMGRMLLLKNMHKLDHIRYNSELKHSAVYIPDRSKLFYLLNDEVKEKELELVVSLLPEEKPLEHIVNSDLVYVEPIVVQDDSIEGLVSEDVVEEIIQEDNYLEASDNYEDSVINRFNFTFSPYSSVQQTENDGLEDVILPAADLLDYEMTTSAGYTLPSIDDVSDVDPDANRSFSDWLYVMRYSDATPEKQKDKNAGMNLIDNFLNAEPKIIPDVSKKQDVIDLSESVDEDDGADEDILSETLADIYIKQGYKKKAISIFEKLHLKYPEKNVYFARRIRELKEN